MGRKEINFDFAVRSNKSKRIPRIETALLLIRPVSGKVESIVEIDLFSRGGRNGEIKRKREAVT